MAIQHSTSAKSQSRLRAVAAIVCLVLCLGWLFSLAGAIAFGMAEFTCDYYPLVILPTAFGFGLASSLLTGNIRLSADSGIGAAFPSLRNHPMLLSASGGFAVMLLVFGVGMLIKPEKCNFRSEFSIKFEHIPKDAQVSVSPTFWRKHHGFDEHARHQSISLLAEDRPTEGILTVYFQETNTTCALEIITTDTSAFGSDHDLEVFEPNVQLETILISFDVSRTVIEKSSNPACFKRKQ